ncbi:PLC-like phosphodiesterase [Cladochytrium replicatum]|nr:PLC-like phosphodiesterase [Cladochytrium replicatum]
MQAPRWNVGLQLWAHRGGGALERIENTLAGFRHACRDIQPIPDVLEFDCSLTKDGIPVVFHDNTMERLCGPSFKDKKISDYNYDELPPLAYPPKLSPRWHLTSTGSPKLLKDPDQAEVMKLSGIAEAAYEDCRKAILAEPDASRIPKLEEVFREFPNHPMQIDVKTGPAELVKKVGDMIIEHGRAKITVWGSFVPKVWKECFKQFGEEIPMLMNLNTVLSTYCAWYVGFPLRWLPYIGFASVRTVAVAVIPDLDWLLKPGYVRALNVQLGVAVVVWGMPGGGLNSVDRLEFARAAGAQGICTDVPTLGRKWLEEGNRLKTVQEVQEEYSQSKLR